MRIKKVHIRNFRSIQDETIELNNLNILVGKNDSGKSNLLKALNLFFNGNTGWNEEFLFERDYCTFAKKGEHKAEEISITLYFEIQETWAVWQKRWRNDSPGKTDLTSMWDQKAKKSERKETGFKSHSRVPSALRRVNYFYIPALKSPQFIAELIGNLNKVLSKNTKDDLKLAAASFEDALAKYFSEITEELNEALGLKNILHMPQNLHPIFEALEFIDQNKHSLTQHGDGIRSQHIPVLLNHIAHLTHELKPNRESYSSFIWGYEEPENNIELGQAYKFANTFIDHAKNQQIILTTHSPAFYSLPESIDSFGKKSMPLFEDILSENKTYWQQGTHSINRFFVRHSTAGETSFNTGNIEELDDNFILPIASRFQMKINALEKEKNHLLDKLQKLDKPAVIYVEGITDKTILETAWDKLFSGDHLPFIIEPRGNDQNVRAALNTEGYYTLNPNIVYIGIFDFDSAYNQWNGLADNWVKQQTDSEKGLLKKHKTKNGYGLLLPVPAFRKHQAGENLKHNSILTIELLFPDQVLKANVDAVTDYYNPRGELKCFKGDKVAFAKKTRDFGIADFEEFRKIFDIVNSILAENTNHNKPSFGDKNE